MLQPFNPTRTFCIRMLHDAYPVAVIQFVHCRPLSNLIDIEPGTFLRGCISTHLRVHEEISSPLAKNGFKHIHRSSKRMTNNSKSQTPDSFSSIVRLNPFKGIFHPAFINFQWRSSLRINISRLLLTCFFLCASLQFSLCYISLHLRPGLWLFEICNNCTLTFWKIHQADVDRVKFSPFVQPFLYIPSSLFSRSLVQTNNGF